MSETKAFTVECKTGHCLGLKVLTPNGEDITNYIRNVKYECGVDSPFGILTLQCIGGFVGKPTDLLLTALPQNTNVLIEELKAESE